MFLSPHILSFPSGPAVPEARSCEPHVPCEGVYSVMCVYVYHLPIRNRNVDQYHISKSLIRTPEDSLTYLVLDEMYTIHQAWLRLMSQPSSTSSHNTVLITIYFSYVVVTKS